MLCSQAEWARARDRHIIRVLDKLVEGKRDDEGLIVWDPALADFDDDDKEPTPEPTREPEDDEDDEDESN